ncbi:MAG: SPFH domain-containing protein [Microlunatus sp.]
MTSPHATESTGAERVPAAADQALHEPAGEPVGHAGTRVVVNERSCWRISGWIAVIGLAVLLSVIGKLSIDFVRLIESGLPSMLVPAIGLLAVLAGLLASTLVVVQPGTTRVVQFFGRYLGTIRHPGLSMTVPLSTKTQVSVRVNNFETARLKVNDADGNPVDVAAIVVWQVADTAKAHYAVEDYRAFNQVQAEAALRHVAGEHPYDDTSGSGTSLRGSTDVVAEELAREVAARVSVAGLEIVEVRISHLAYAQEIAQAMLQRQQASAVVAARERIVEGAVGMVEMALGRLSEREIVELDDERRAAMVSNLLVVLCGESRATPVVNTGSLYN